MGELKGGKFLFKQSSCDC